MPKSGLTAAILTLCAGLTSCASTVELGEIAPPTRVPLVLPEHGRFVAQAVLSDARGAMEATAHIAFSPRGVRAHLGTTSGLTISDIEVNGADVIVHAESELGRLPGLRDRVAADLRRLFGDRSVFATEGVRTVFRDVLDAPTDAPTHRIALGLVDGSWAVARRSELELAGSALHVTLLDARRHEEAAVTYEDVDTDAFPRFVQIDDLTDGHHLELEMVPVEGGAPGTR